MSKLRHFFRSFFKQPPKRPGARTAFTTPASVLALSMASYTTTITRISELGPSPEDATSRPHHIKKNGTTVSFKNIHPSFGDGVGLSRMFQHVVWPRLTGKLQSPDTTPPTVSVVKPEFLSTRNASQKLRATWLGHACYYVEFPSGLRVLFDPVFEDRCSPFSFVGPKRYTPKPCDLAEIPFVDAVLISHSHYDHLSHESVITIQKHNPDVHFFVGMGLESWFKKAGLKNVTELDWWEDAELSLSINKNAIGEFKAITAQVSCLPCQHTSARTPFDKDTTLWASWAVKSDEKSVWFGGDTGYRAVPYVPPNVDDYGQDFAALPVCPQFKQIGEFRGPFDLGLIPIGAYYPRVAFSPMHANPFDSVEIFQDTKCQHAMGIHWGTWALTMEEVLEPPRLLRQAMKRKGLPETGVFDVCDIGESKEF
ncbi:N-acyl-phosphatidylethanolamine-hydrolyzing phospholipase D [Colletotrichum sojae]|uniref:N-acyl-phosphatidylethanolamine-hydrolyzing phospholipase D n=1 Tax=Colletotrichum sojae TaxID=2175907 RepID=A0A8H6MQK4_9PEZI|nr:N-acyl-phosphatidylethanolamine-hydrolyzing phospholipase D [Colletotrichum sojae]